MKRIVLVIAAFVGVLLALTATAQTVDCNGATGWVNIPGTALRVKCPDAGTNLPPVNPPPVTPPPSTGCSASQLSTPIAGKTFQRQCAGSVIMQPSGVGGGIVAFTDLGPLFGGKPFPNYIYSGQSPTFYVDSGYYVALAFTPNANGLIKFTANNSYGDGGTISLSTFAGGLTAGTPGVICASAGGGLNSMIVSTLTGYCPVKIGQTYNNFADTNANGEQLCFGGMAGACAQSRVSYAFTARAQ